MLEGKPCKQKVPDRSRLRLGVSVSLLFFTTPRGGQLLLPGCTSILLGERLSRLQWLGRLLSLLGAGYLSYSLMQT